MAKASLTPDQQFKRICENGFGFVSTAIEQLWENGSPDTLKYSVINFYSGVELLLKARLMHEHWSLIVADPSKADIDEFLNGEAQTVGLKQAVQRLKKAARVSVPTNAVNSFDELRIHRNRMVHFYHPIEVNDLDQGKQRDAVVFEQCRGWFYLRRLLGDEWHDVFERFQQDVQDINSGMKHHREYLRTVYEQIRPDLENEQRNGAFLAPCSACGFEAQVLDVVGPQEQTCRVCLARETFLIEMCPDDSCKQKVLLPAEECEDWQCSHCGTLVHLSEVLFHYTIEGKLDDDELHQLAFCTECGNAQTAATLVDGERAFCFHCFSWHGTIEYCQWCNEPFTGDAEGTYWSGCDQCEGKAGWSKHE
jgi:hypothetical protein